MTTFGGGYVKKGQGMSSETTSFLDGLMKERGLSRREMGTLKTRLGVTEPQPEKATTSKPPKTISVPKVGAGRNAPPAVQGGGVLGRFGGKKLQHEIKRDNPNEPELILTKPGVDREAEKDKLAKYFEFNGKTEAQRNEAVADMKRKKAAAAPPAPKKEEPKEEIDKLLQEIEERQDWLDDMKRIGAATKEHEDRIKGEVALRMKLVRGLGY